MGQGESAALLAAAAWASASLLYSGTKLSAWGLNLGKNILASGVLLIQLVIVTSFSGEPLFQADLNAWWWLGLSAVIGIVIGDTCYFRSLQILGPRKALIVSTTAPIFAAVLGFVLLGEAAGPAVLAGMLMTVGGVIYVIAERSSSGESPGLFPGSTASGVTAGIAAAVCQALGGVCSRIGMRDCGGVEGALIRLLVSAVGVIVIVAFRKQLREILRKLADRQLLKRFVPAVLLGTWLGIWLSQVAYKYATVSVATTLLATTPLFVLPLVRVFHGRRITPAAVGGTIIAVVGVALVVFGADSGSQ